VPDPSASNAPASQPLTYSGVGFGSKYGSKQRDLPDPARPDPVQRSERVPRVVCELAEPLEPEIPAESREAGGERCITDSQLSPNLGRSAAEGSIASHRPPQVAHLVGLAKDWRANWCCCQAQFANPRRLSKSVFLQPETIPSTRDLAKCRAKCNCAGPPSRQCFDRCNSIPPVKTGLRSFVKPKNPFALIQFGCRLPREVRQEDGSLRRCANWVFSRVDHLPGGDGARSTDRTCPQSRRESALPGEG